MQMKCNITTLTPFVQVGNLSLRCNSCELSHISSRSWSGFTNVGASVLLQVTGRL